MFNFQKNAAKSLCAVQKSRKIFQNLPNFSPTTDRAPTTFRLLSTTGREACRRWEDLREEAESLESTHSCSFDGGGKGRVSNNCIVSLQSVFAVITENWMFLPSPQKKERRAEVGSAPVRAASWPWRTRSNARGRSHFRRLH